MPIFKGGKVPILTLIRSFLNNFKNLTALGKTQCAVSFQYFLGYVFVLVLWIDFHKVQELTKSR